MRVDVLDLVPGPFFFDLALQFGELFTQLGDMPVFFFKPAARVLALFEDQCNEFGLGQERKPRLVRAGLYGCLSRRGLSRR